MKLEAKIQLILIVGVILTLISPYLFTLSLGVVDFSSTGNIGDTIGGITSPIVGLIGSILVYYALKAQIDANTVIQQQITEQKKSDYERKIVAYLSEQLKMIKEDINDFEFAESQEKKKDGEKIKETKIYKGSEAINKYLELLKIYRTESIEDLFVDIYQFEQLRLLLELIDNFLDLIISEKISPEDKGYLLYNLKYLYNSKIKPHLDYNNDHTNNPDIIYQLSNKIESKMIVNHS